jgi:hypothetical protein
MREPLHGPGVRKLSFCPSLPFALRPTRGAGESSRLAPFQVGRGPRGRSAAAARGPREDRGDSDDQDPCSARGDDPLAAARGLLVQEGLGRHPGRARRGAGAARAVGPDARLGCRRRRRRGRPVSRALLRPRLQRPRGRLLLPRELRRRQRRRLPRLRQPHPRARRDLRSARELPRRLPGPGLRQAPPQGRRHLQRRLRRRGARDRLPQQRRLLPRRVQRRERQRLHRRLRQRRARAGRDLRSARELPDVLPHEGLHGLRAARGRHLQRRVRRGPGAGGGLPQRRRLLSARLHGRERQRVPRVRQRRQGSRRAVRSAHELPDELSGPGMPAPPPRRSRDVQRPVRGRRSSDRLRRR